MIVFVFVFSDFLQLGSRFWALRACLGVLLRDSDLQRDCVAGILSLLGYLRQDRFSKYEFMRDFELARVSPAGSGFQSVFFELCL